MHLLHFKNKACVCKCYVTTKSDESLLLRAEVTPLPVCPTGPYFRKLCMIMDGEGQIIFFNLV